MDFWNVIARAKRGFRDDLRLHVVAVASLVIAFVCLGAAMLSVTNLSLIAERWGDSKHLTIYLDDKAPAGDVGQLRLVLEGLKEVDTVRHVSAAQARKEFAEQTDIKTDLAALPPDVFPASLEVKLASNVSTARVDKIAERVKRFGAVAEVEAYRDWFGQIGGLVRAGQSGAFLLALLVIICVLAVIGNTIRLAVAGRRREIEVLKFCGATDSFVRTPFLVEGATQAAIAAMVALFILFISYLMLSAHLQTTLTAITGVRAVFLHPLAALGMVLGGGLVGCLGSAMSLRRYLTV